MISNIKIEFKDYPSGNWEDWSEYLADISSLSKNVESDNPGEAGTIVFDEVKISLRYLNGEPPYNKFSIDLSNINRYLFRISSLKSDGTFVPLFEGISDFSSISWNDYENVVEFSVVDKLSALGILTAEQIRDHYLIKDRLSDAAPLSTEYQFQYNNGVPNHIWICAAHPNVYDDLNSVLVNPGEVVDIPEIVSGESRLRVITKSWLEIHPIYNKICNRVEFVPHLDSTNYNTIIYDGNNWLNHKAYKSLVYGEDINNIVSDELVSLDGLKLIKALYNQAWPGTNFTVIPGSLTFNVPAEYAVRLVENNPFGKSPLDAIITLVNSIKPAGGISGSYLYVNKQGNLVLQSKNELTGGNQRDLSNTKIFGNRKKYFWDKLADACTVNLKSWIIDKKTGEYLQIKQTVTLKPPYATGFIKPKNEIKKELITTELPGVNEDPLLFLKNKAIELAQDYLTFYGKRRVAWDLTLNLDDNTVAWDILDFLTKGSESYIITNIQYNLITREITFQLVGTTGYNYDIRQVIFASPDYSYNGDTTSGYVSSINTIIGTSELNFLAPLDLTSLNVSLKFTGNLKLTNGELDIVQDIMTTSTPTFAQLTLSSAGTTTSNAVRADRAINTNYPLTGGGNLTADRTIGLNYNTTNLKLTSNQLNTIQDIGTTATPTICAH
ncbi:hypothetical protein [Ignavibacterium sp.]|uniref:hypothetical protein n=1 Tax=Ignavibacterium sp. TaxID=2651167 RepID=UPI0021FD9881|nr:hypothetical protein [Ignavibacterium sp.]BDQ03486.1 MAG: hypothetical protein KatS3mg037_2061 [Ignavibacterium sp.]